MSPRVGRPEGTCVPRCMHACVMHARDHEARRQERGSGKRARAGTMCVAAGWRLLPAAGVRATSGGGQRRAAGDDGGGARWAARQAMGSGRRRAAAVGGSKRAEVMAAAAGAVIGRLAVGEQWQSGEVGGEAIDEASGTCHHGDGSGTSGGGALARDDAAARAGAGV